MSRHKQTPTTTPKTCDRQKGCELLAANELKDGSKWFLSLTFFLLINPAVHFPRRTALLSFTPSSAYFSDVCINLCLHSYFLNIGTGERLKVIDSNKNTKTCWETHATNVKDKHFIFFWTVHLCDCQGDADSADPHQVLQQEEFNGRDATLKRRQHTYNILQETTWAAVANFKMRFPCRPLSMRSPCSVHSRHSSPRSRSLARLRGFPSPRSWTSRLLRLHRSTWTGAWQHVRNKLKQWFCLRCWFLGTRCTVKPEGQVYTCLMF